MRLKQSKAKKHKTLRYMRLINNMSIKELAYKSHVAPGLLKNIEDGTLPCSELNARRLAELFGDPREWQIFVRQ